MERKKRRLSRPIKIILAVIALALLLAPMIPQWQRHRQYALDRRLIMAIRTHDLSSALTALQSGADANAWEQYDVVCPILQTFVEPEFSPTSDPVPLIRAWSDAEAYTLIKALLDHGAEISPGTRTSPLWYVAQEKGHERTMGLLLLRGASPNQADDEGKTPLFVASSNEKAELLLRYGANIHARDNHQSTALLDAVREQNAERVRLLCQHGADVTAEDDPGNTPLSLAKSNRDRALIQILKQYGAKK